LGKTVVLWEETAKCTTEAAGIWVLTSKERFSEITTGRSYFQMGWQQPSKTRLIGYNRRRWEDLGLAHEVVVAKREG